MRKILFFMAALLAVSFIGCSKEESKNTNGLVGTKWVLYDMHPVEPLIFILNFTSNSEVTQIVYNGYGGMMELEEAVEGEYYTTNSEIWMTFNGKKGQSIWRGVLSDDSMLVYYVDDYKGNGKDYIGTFIKE